MRTGKGQATQLAYTSSIGKRLYQFLAELCHPSFAKQCVIHTVGFRPGTASERPFTESQRLSARLSRA